MSVFRIQRKKLESDSRHKVHSQQSKSYSKNAKNLTQILMAAQQKQKAHIQIKKRVLTIQEKQDDSNYSKIKRISEAYNIGVNKKQNLRNSKVSKKSFSGTRFIPIFSPRKKTQSKFHPYQGIIKSSPKLEGKLSIHIKTSERSNMNEQRSYIQKSKRQYMSLNSSFVSKGSKNKIQTNRIISQQKMKKISEIYSEGLEEYKNKNSKRALILFTQCLGYQPQNMDCLYYIGSCYLNLNQNQKSVKYLIELVELNPCYNRNVYLYLGINYKILRKQEQGIRILQRGLKQYVDFEQGYLYLGKLYTKQCQYEKAIKVLQKCIQLNKHNIIAKLILADIFSYIHKQNKTIQLLLQVLKQQQYNKIKYQNTIIGNQKTIAVYQKTLILDQKTKISTHLKLIKSIITIQMFNHPQLQSSINYIQLTLPTSPQLAYYKSFIKYSTQSIISPTQLSQIKINLYFALNQLNTYIWTLDCTKLLLKIHIDHKDFYGAEQLLKRISQTSNKNNLKQYTLFIQGANDIIKRKTQDAKSKIQKCIQLLTLKNHNKQSPAINYLASKDKFYLRLHALQFLAYILFIQEKFVQSLQIYSQILLNNKTQSNRSNKYKVIQENFIKRYHQKFTQIQINKIVLQSIIDHKNDSNFIKARKGFQLACEKRQTPEIIFMQIVNEIAILKITQSNNQSSQYYMNQQSNKSFSWASLIQKAQRAQQISPNYSLIYFYHSLMLLYLQNNSQALVKVQLAIQKAEQPVSQYHFIQALCYYLIFQEVRDIQISYRGLQAIDRAIQIDAGIPQFYKQRSKHLFCMGKYEQCIKDCERCQAQNPDEQAKLLCMFYYYASNNYQKSQVLLNQLINTQQFQSRLDRNKTGRINNQTTKEINKQQKYEQIQLQSLAQHKYKQFQQALMFRLKKYQRTGIISKLLMCLTQQKTFTLDNRYLNMIHHLIQNRQQYSQFTVYFINLLIASYFIYQGDFTGSLNYLFSCREEIQCIIDEKNIKLHNYTSEGEDQNNQKQKEQNLPMSRFNQEIAQIDTDTMLNEIKYNIVIATLIKNYGQRTIKIKQFSYTTIQECYHQSLNFIDTFNRESQSQELIQNLQIIKNLILKSQYSQSLEQNTQQKLNGKFDKLASLLNNTPIYLKPYIQIQKFSDQIPFLNIPIGDKYKLMTKYLIFYPMKLRFNIKPQFDTSFLFNFDIDKVQNRLTPPWYKFSQIQSKGGLFQNRIIFTDQLRNQSIAISQTQRQPSIVNNNKKSKNRYMQQNIKQQQITILKTGSQKVQKVQKVGDFRDLIKLDSNIQKKLKKLFPK